MKSIQRKHIKKNKTIQNDEILVEKNGPLCYNSKEVLTIRGDFAMASKKRNIIVGQSQKIDFPNGLMRLLREGEKFDLKTKML